MTKATNQKLVKFSTEMVVKQVLEHHYSNASSLSFVTQWDRPLLVSHSVSCYFLESHNMAITFSSPKDNIVVFQSKKNKTSQHHLDYLFSVYYTLENLSGFSRKRIINKSISFVLLESDTLLHIHEDLIKKKKRSRRVDKFGRLILV